MADLIKNAAQHARAGEAGRLELGGDLRAWIIEGGTVPQFKEQVKRYGVDLPSDSRLSVYKSTYQAWVVDAGLPIDHAPIKVDGVVDDQGNMIPMHLTGVTVDKLYHLKNEVHGGNASDLLAWAYTHTDAQHRARSANAQVEPEPDGGRDREAREQSVEEVRVKTLKLNEDSYNAFLSLVDRLRGTQANPNISKAQTFDFIVGQFEVDSLSDEGLSFLWRQAHGEVTEEEMEAAEEIDLEISDDE